MRYSQNTSEKGLELLQKLQAKQYFQFVPNQSLLEIERVGMNTYRLSYNREFVANLRYSEVRKYIAKLYPKAT